MKKRGKDGKWEVSLHQYDLFLHSLHYSGKTPYSWIKIPHRSKQNIHFRHTSTKITHTLLFLSPLDRSTERHCVTWSGTWTLNPEKRSDIAAWLCFQTDHVTHQKREGREESGWWGRVTGERRIIRCGDCVLTGVRVWGWTGREALGETGVCFCSGDYGEDEEKKTQFSWSKIVLNRDLCMNRTGKNTINHFSHAFVLTE